VAGALRMWLVVQNSYFKDDDFSENPIKTYNKIYRLTSIYNTSQYNYMQLSVNNVTMKDGAILGGVREGSFV
jgi:isoleucyl-tRNA synthetase